MEGLGLTVVLGEEVPFDEFNENVQDLDVEFLYAVRERSTRGTNVDGA